MITTKPGAPESLGRRVSICVRVLWRLMRVEATIRRRTLPQLCEAAGIEFAGFDDRSKAVSATVLPVHVSDVWWAVETTLRIWPFGRGRPCLRRCLVLGHQIRYLDPVLSLAVVATAPLSMHARLVVRGIELDLGRLETLEVRSGGLL